MDTNLVVKKEDLIKIFSIEGEIDAHFSKEDILGCGHKIIEDEGICVIVTDIVDVRKDIIFSSLVLRHFGLEYKIEKTFEYDNEDTGCTEVFLYTNLPYEQFKEILDDLYK